MFLHNITKYIFILFLLHYSGESFSQSDSGKLDESFFKVKSKLRNEYNPYFKFNTFYRGVLDKKLKADLELLDNKERTDWNYADSVQFAKINLTVGNYDLASYYFDSLEINPKNEKETNLLYIISFYVQGRYKEGLSKINKDYHGTLEYSELYYIKRIFESRDSLESDNKWYRNKTVFPFDNDLAIFDLDKKSDTFKNKVILPLENGRTVLELFVRYIHKNDPIIARAFNDMGLCLERHISLQEAYIAYNIARKYNKKDKEIHENIERVNLKMEAKNYKTPHFQKVFPSIDFKKLNYEVLKEEISEKNKLEDDQKLKEPKLVSDNKKEPIIDVPFPIEIFYTVGLILLFLFILIFVKTKKKK